MRIFLLHHVKFSIDSLCHFYGRRPFATGDQSRNLAWGVIRISTGHQDAKRHVSDRGDGP